MTKTKKTGSKTPHPTGGGKAGKGRPGKSSRSAPRERTRGGGRGKTAKTPHKTTPGKRRGQAGSQPLSAKGVETLLHLEDLLLKRIHGKDDAIARIGSALRVRLAQLDFRPERPNGSFLLIGPPGVGKNEFAYALAGILYGDESLVVPIDMRSVTSEEDASRLTDSLITGPPALLLEGMMTTPVRRRPNSILLLRGVENAHPAAHRMIQQILEQGWIEDARGRTNFQHTIVFATSQVPEDENGLTDQIGFNRHSKSFDERVREKMVRRLGEEFVESFLEVIVIHPLTADDVRKIARYKVDVVLQRLKKGKLGVSVSDSVFRTFIPDDDCSKSGAGMINRTLENRLLNPLAQYILSHPKDREISVDVKNGALVIEPALRRGMAPPKTPRA
jgi:ATP-dependent Clp protease ATP-binding subunit ClpA